MNGVTAQYTHTLTVTGRLPGVYTCTVDNKVSPQDSESFTVESISEHPQLLLLHYSFFPPVASAPTDLTAVQEGPISIRVSWTPSSDATGYTVSYTGGGSSDSETVSGGSTDERLLTDLVKEASYTISIVATSSQTLPSDALVVEITLSKANVYPTCSCTYNSSFLCVVSVPGQPRVSAVTSITATSISLSWSVPSGSVVTSSEVMWREASSGTSEGTSGSLTDTSYTIDQLESNTIYTITVTVSNTAGSTDSHPITSEWKATMCIVWSSFLSPYQYSSHCQ